MCSGSAKYDKRKGVELAMPLGMGQGSQRVGGGWTRRRQEMVEDCLVHASTEISDVVWVGMLFGRCFLNGGYFHQVAVSFSRHFLVFRST